MQCHYPQPPQAFEKTLIYLKNPVESDKNPKYLWSVKTKANTHTHANKQPNRRMSFRMCWRPGTLWDGDNMAWLCCKADRKDSRPDWLYSQRRPQQRRREMKRSEAAILKVFLVYDYVYLHNDKTHTHTQYNWSVFLIERLMTPVLFTKRKLFARQVISQHLKRACLMWNTLQITY